MYTHIIRDLKRLGSAEKARKASSFFKTGEGQYGAGDVFIGVTVPEQRSVATTYRNTPLADIEKLLESKIHEHRLTALEILVLQYEKGDTKTQKKIVDFYLKHTQYINNWDLVDASASYILGAYVYDKNRAVLYRLARSKNMWERRIAIVATHYCIARGDFIDTLAIAEMLLPDTHDLIHKAVGWMLREVYKRDEKVLVNFLDTRIGSMPRTTLRYAIERFPEKMRKAYLKK